MAEADRGRQPGFQRFNIVADGPGSLAVLFGFKAMVWQLLPSIMETKT
jgi:hypothetical protein